MALIVRHHVCVGGVLVATIPRAYVLSRDSLMRVTAVCTAWLAHATVVSLIYYHGAFFFFFGLALFAKEALALVHWANIALPIAGAPRRICLDRFSEATGATSGTSRCVSNCLVTLPSHAWMWWCCSDDSVNVDACCAHVVSPKPPRRHE